MARNEWKYVADVDYTVHETLPLVACHAGEFNQVILNLVVNAAHAIAKWWGMARTKRDDHRHARGAMETA